MNQSSGKPVVSLAPEVLFIFGLIAVLGYYAVWRSFNPPAARQSPVRQDFQQKLDRQLAAPPVLDSPVLDTLTQYYEGLAEIRPSYVSRDVFCPLDNTPLKLPVMKNNAAGQRMDNVEGGIASDFMKIAVGPPVGGSAMPDLLLQQWEQLPVVCPTCRNTYQESSLNNLRWPERLQALKDNWKLEQVSPGLARYSYRDWTPDQMQYGHYLSSRAAQTEHIELGWTALSGAYAANFSVWSGEHDYYIPSPAFYALAAAEFQSAIELDWEGLPDKSKSETIMALLVCQRLLGREADARRTLELAREVLKLEPRMLPALEMEEAYLDEARFSLERVNLEQRAAPVIGWQLDKMLPAMNGHIFEHRADWAELRQLPAVLDAIETRLQARADELAAASSADDS